MVTVPATGKVLIKDKKRVPTGKWVTLSTVTIPKKPGYRYILTLQVGMPRTGGMTGESRLARVGWGGDASTQGGMDYTGHNPIPSGSLIQRWRTPIHHEMAGGGPVAVQVFLNAPEGSMVSLPFVVKATRFKVT